MHKFLLLLALAGCSGFQNKVRTEAALFKKNDLIISNTQTNPYVLDVDDGLVDLNYSILLKNEGKTDKLINPEKASLVINEEIRPLKCSSSMHSKPPYVLKPAKYLKLTCSERFSANSKNKIAVRDTDAQLHVPLEANNAVAFKYRLFIEDFE